MHLYFHSNISIFSLIHPFPEVICYLQCIGQPKNGLERNEKFKEKTSEILFN